MMQWQKCGRLADFSILPYIQQEKFEPTDSYQIIEYLTFTKWNGLHLALNPFK